MSVGVTVGVSGAGGTGDGEGSGVAVPTSTAGAVAYVTAASGYVDSAVGDSNARIAQAVSVWRRGGALQDAYRSHSDRESQPATVSKSATAAVQPPSAMASFTSPYLR